MYFFIIQILLNTGHLNILLKNSTIMYSYSCLIPRLIPNLNTLPHTEYAIY